MYSEGFLCNRQFPSTTKNLKGIKKESIFLGAGNLHKQTVRAKKDNIILGMKITSYYSCCRLTVKSNKNKCQA